MSTAGIFVTDKSNAVQTYMVAAVVAESPDWVQWHIVAVLPPLPLVPESCPADIFKEEDSMVACDMPGITVLSFGACDRHQRIFSSNL